MTEAAGRPFLPLVEALVVRLAGIAGGGSSRGARQRRKRDLVAEISTFLADHPGASTLEIARGIKARDVEVRRALASGGRFQRVPPGLGRPANAKTWVLVSEDSPLVPLSGTRAGGAGPRVVEAQSAEPRDGDPETSQHNWQPGQTEG